MLDFIVIVFIVSLGFVFIYLNSRKMNLNGIKTLKALWLYHLLFSLIYYVYTRYNVADSNGYWRIAKESGDGALDYFLSKGPGTPFVYVLNYFPSKILDFSIFSGTLLYSIVSFIGFFFYYKIIVELIPHNYKFYRYNLFPLLLFLPSLHFWSGGVGKDTLMFFAIGMFGYSLLNLGKRIPFLILSMFLCYMVRPHILFFLLIAFGSSFLISSKLSGFKRMFFFLVLIAISIVILPNVLQYVDLDGGSFDEILIRTETQARNLSGGFVGSSVDISSYPFPLKIFTFLYRPLFFDINGITAVIASFENLLLLIFSYKILKYKPIKTFREAPVIIKGFLFFLIIGAMILSLSLSNFGIILRMKNMFMPGFLLYILWAMSYRQSVALNKKKQADKKNDKDFN